MKELAKSCQWWPGLDKEFESLVRGCTQCLENKHMPVRSELHPWEWPEQPWHRIHVDYAGPIKDKYFLVIVYSMTKWVEVFPTRSPTANETINCLRGCFARFGLPVSVVSDNGPCFTSSLFQQYLQKNGIQQITTAVYKPATNDLAERMVQTFKAALATSSDPLDVFSK